MCIHVLVPGRDTGIILYHIAALHDSRSIMFVLSLSLAGSRENQQHTLLERFVNKLYEWRVWDWVISHGHAPAWHCPCLPSHNPSSSSDSDMVSSLREIVVITIIIMIYRSFTSGQKTILGETRAKLQSLLSVSSGEKCVRKLLKNNCQNKQLTRCLVNVKTFFLSYSTLQTVLFNHLPGDDFNSNFSLFADCVH